MSLCDGSPIPYGRDPLVEAHRSAKCPVHAFGFSTPPYYCLCALSPQETIDGLVDAVVHDTYSDPPEPCDETHCEDSTCCCYQDAYDDIKPDLDKIDKAVDDSDLPRETKSLINAHIARIKDTLR